MKMKKESNWCINEISVVDAVSRILYTMFTVECPRFIPFTGGSWRWNSMNRVKLEDVVEAESTDTSHFALLSLFSKRVPDIRVTRFCKRILHKKISESIFKGADPYLKYFIQTSSW